MWEELVQWAIKRTKRYKLDFGESRRSKIDVMRAEKQFPEVTQAFFNRAVAIHAHHARLSGFVVGNVAPGPCTVFDVGEVLTNPGEMDKEIG